MKFPCEIIVWKVLPAIRAEMARNLAKEGMNQKEIAKVMGITEAAVSQYANKKRAAEFKIGKSFGQRFKGAAKQLKETGSPIRTVEVCCEICREIREQGCMCSLHKESSDQPKDCALCKGKC
ncbi:MAG: helix-turn-helix domain-containing protein [archaeon]